MGVVKDRRTLADNNEALAFSSIDIESQVSSFGRRHPGANFY
jgi:hypothetical protein